MKITFSGLWQTSGTIDRGTYAVIGLVGFALKHNIDRLVAFSFHRPWGFFNYWVPMQDIRRIGDLHSNDAVFLETLVLASLPFIWIGVAQTMKRLRSTGLSPYLIVLFFAPFLNLLFFIALCLWPERAQSAQVPLDGGVRQMFPGTALGSAALALLITVPLGVLIAWAGERILTSYGWGLFVALPFTMGFAAAVIYGLRQPRQIGGCVGVACLSVALFGCGLLAVAIEGVLCLFMAMPIALPLAAIGGAFGYLVQRQRWFPTNAPAVLGMLLIFSPGVQWIEHATQPTRPVFVVRSSIDIQAPPEKVWKQVIAFSEIPPPTEWLFRAGIAYPIRAGIAGTGPGAERHCVFSTGAFVEPIQIWDEPRLLKFSVTSNPAPMDEWTPYSHIDPPHLHGFLQSNGGQFWLTRLPNGGTRLEGTTWYQHGLWPAEYWRLWSDAIIHKIHMRVLRHIRDEVEKAG